MTKLGKLIIITITYNKNTKVYYKNKESLYMFYLFNELVLEVVILAGNGIEGCPNEFEYIILYVYIFPDFLFLYKICLFYN